MAKDKVLGAAIFGAGWVAGEHARAYQACARTKLVAVGSRKEESARKCAEYADAKDAFLTTDFDALLKRPDGSWLGDQFDGEGFVRGVARKGKVLAGARALVVGAGGVGSAIAASLAAAGIAGIGLFDAHGTAADALGNRLKEHYPKLAVRTGSNDPEGYDVVVNATPLGMKPGDPLPVDVAKIAPNTFVGEVVMKEEYTPFLRAAMEKGCPIQVGTDMLFEQIPAYLEFFGFKSTTPEQLRELSQIKYQ